MYRESHPASSFTTSHGPTLVSRQLEVPNHPCSASRASHRRRCRFLNAGVKFHADSALPTCILKEKTVFHVLFLMLIRGCCPCSLLPQPRFWGQQCPRTFLCSHQTKHIEGTCWVPWALHESFRFIFNLAFLDQWALLSSWTTEASVFRIPEDVIFFLLF